MVKKTIGTVIYIDKLWWMKMDMQPIRIRTLTGFPHIIKVKYRIDGVDYIKKKFLIARNVPLRKGDRITVLYQISRPAKGKSFYLILAIK